MTNEINDKENILVLVTEENKEDMVKAWGYKDWKEYEKQMGEDIVGNLFHLCKEGFDMKDKAFEKYKKDALTVEEINKDEISVAFLMGDPNGDRLYHIGSKKFREDEYCG